MSPPFFAKLKDFVARSSGPGATGSGNLESLSVFGKLEDVSTVPRNAKKNSSGPKTKIE